MNRSTLARPCFRGRGGGLLVDASARHLRHAFALRDRHREGGFVGDFLNVKRVTKTTGWSFDALVVANDGIVLFRNWGGQPNSDRLDRQINPLGPLQPAGESAGALLR